MNGRPNLFASHLALVGSVVLATVAIQRHLGRFRRNHAEQDTPVPVTPAGHPLGVVASHGTDILKGTYERINRDRILANAAGVVF